MIKLWEQSYYGLVYFVFSVFFIKKFNFKLILVAFKIFETLVKIYFLILASIYLPESERFLPGFCFAILIGIENSSGIDR